MEEVSPINIYSAKIAVKHALEAELKAFKKVQDAEIRLNSAKRMVRQKLEILEQLDKEGK
jgi:hypothetical protein